MKFRKYISWAFVVAIMIGIFWFSAQPANDSHKTSHSVTRKIVDSLPKTRKKSEAEKKEITKKWNNYTRKYAHFTSYAFLGLFMMLALLSTARKMSGINQIFTAAAVCYIYAVTDEIHQNFVPGRGPLFTDTLIDFGGAMTGILVVFAVSSAIRVFHKSA